MQNDKLLEVILDEVRDSRKAVALLDDKLDRKVDILHGRITQESGCRGELEKEVGCIRGKLAGIVSRINWLYVIIGGLIVTCAGVVVTFIVTKG